MTDPTIAPAALPRYATHALRFLAMDAVQQAKSGHPGQPMGMADVAMVLWNRYLKHNPANPAWPDRDRFVLSAGHGSMLLYGLLHLSGYDLSMDELKRFRQLHSKTPGHPEYGHVPGVEVTTGPLGQGISNAVGMALAERWLAARFNRDKHTLIDHHTYVICGDGDLMEGVSHESCSLAGHLGLGKLIVFYDDNEISIDGSTDLSFTEDVDARFGAYGWHVQRIDGHDQAAIAKAIEAAQGVPDKPSLISCRTVIGWGAPHLAGSEKTHGSPLGEEEIAATREALGWPWPPFVVPEPVLAFWRENRARGAAAEQDWQARLAGYRTAHGEAAVELERVAAGKPSLAWEQSLAALREKWAQAPPAADATRSASGKVLEAVAMLHPDLLGGSADLTPSNNTRVDAFTDIDTGSFGGKYVRYGVREHAMGAVMNGLALHGGVVPYAGTFLVFSDYMRPAIRLAAMMAQQVVYVFTHDSIGLGEDGPTHQPVEHLAALRAIPNLVLLRPADVRETLEAWDVALRRTSGPTALILSRQKLPTLAGTGPAAAQGAYVLAEPPQGLPVQVLLLGTGSELALAVEAQQTLAKDKIGARVVSVPSFELFRAQPASYREQVLPVAVSCRVAVEAGVAQGWAELIGAGGQVVGMHGFGASAPYEDLYRDFNITAEAVVAAAREQLGR